MTTPATRSKLGITVASNAWAGSIAAVAGGAGGRLTFGPAIGVAGVAVVGAAVPSWLLPGTSVPGRPADTSPAVGVARGTGTGRGGSWGVLSRRSDVQM